jgi:hypothetical protein
MNRLWLLLLLLAPNLALCQDATRECIAFEPIHSGFSAGSGADVADSARAPLATAVTLSGDFEFYTSAHSGCWTVHVIALELRTEGGSRAGFAVAYTVTNPHEVDAEFALQSGPDQAVFERTMRAAAASAIQDIRFTRKLNQQK